MPRDYPDDEWHGLVEATAALLDELDLPHLAEVARSEATRTVLAAWAHGRTCARLWVPGSDSRQSGRVRWAARACRPSTSMKSWAAAWRTAVDHVG